MTLTAMQTADVRWQRWSLDMQIVVTDASALAVARRETDAELDVVEAATSRFRLDSEINSLTLTSGRPTRVSETLADLLDAALTAARLTDGDVDPTVGAAMVALGYDADIADVRSASPAVPVFTTPAHWSMIAFDGHVVTMPPGVLLDLGATAKAVAADRCAQRAHMVTGSGVLVNLGGDIATAGPAPDGGWQVLVQDADDEPASSLALPAGSALATSSTLRRRWRSGDELMHHILDPRTGRCADPVWRTVSVAAQTCFAANTVATAAVVRGWPALEWIGRLGMAARLVDVFGDVHTIGTWPTSGIEAQR
ncbi:FAD:protein FMN transferase [Mycobacterium antarcticum]|uniref:FAD:protein FMN transferase n=1 Tax=unclassified Mycolicibacterium TaxID=2636767 RepID=UPI0023894D69|nr:MULTISPECIES: FAD:protein FMN transferase [unclassified Mycolicibacterium]GLP76722.1 FAD:protein FMN transferase [Mycolicibacterium sp. TUM20983]GLP82841.1 FAD:protein FMN transferase [Mycolicibacterium sp. TUM20984]